MVGLCMIWGLQQSAMKLVAGSMDMTMQIALRSSIAAVLILALSRAWRRDRWLPGLFAGPGLLTGALFALEFIFVAEGLRWTSASHMAVFLYTAPIFAAIGLHIAQPEERMSVVQWFGVGLAFLGIVAIFLLPELRAGGTPLTRQVILGDLLALAAGISWGMTTVVIRTTRMAGAPPAQTLFYQLATAGVAAMILTTATGRMTITPTTAVIASLSFQTLIVCCASFLIWFRLLQIYPSSRLGVLSLMTPVFGVTWGVILMGDALTAEFLLGGGLVLSGMVVVQAQEWIAARRRQQIRPA